MVIIFLLCIKNMATLSIIYDFHTMITVCNSPLTGSAEHIGTLFWGCISIQVVQYAKQGLPSVRVTRQRSTEITFEPWRLGYSILDISMLQSARAPRAKQNKAHKVIT